MQTTCLQAGAEAQAGCMLWTSADSAALPPGIHQMMAHQVMAAKNPASSADRQVAGKTRLQVTGLWGRVKVLVAWRMVLVAESSCRRQMDLHHQ